MVRGIFDATLAKGEGVLFFDACPVNTGEVADGKLLKPDAEYHTHTCRASAAVIADAIEAGHVTVL